MLVGRSGQEIGAHERNNLLRKMRLLAQHARIAQIFGTVGEVLMVASIVRG